MTTAHVAAQAKINLALRILGREPSGFHALETFFHRLELADDVRVRRTPGERALVCTGRALPPGGLGPARENLAWRAADAYASAAGWEGGFAIEVVKRIPVGAGLGGGSADAGAVLRACDALADAPLGEGRLLELAAGLGSDVAFLTGGSVAALGTGRGEQLAEVAPLPPRDVALVFPGFGVSTSEAYGWLAAARGAYPRRQAVLRPAHLADWGVLSAAAVNDFESVVGQRHAQIPGILEALRAAGAGLAMMSGSGSTVFGIFDERDAIAVRERGFDLPAGATVAWTRTAARVVPVELTG